jgi:hypothetical protein
MLSGFFPQDELGTGGPCCSISTRDSGNAAMRGSVQAPTILLGGAVVASIPRLSLVPDGRL